MIFHLRDPHFRREAEAASRNLISYALQLCRTSLCGAWRGQFSPFLCLFYMYEIKVGELQKDDEVTDEST